LPPTIAIGQALIIDVDTVAIALVALVLLIRLKVDTAIVVLGDGLVGILFL
jgi:hypothetical protein